VNREQKSGRRQIPNNPGLKKLVEGLKEWSRSPDKEQLPDSFAGWHERGYLPHRDEPGLTQFITFHLADAFPKSLRAEWLAVLALENKTVKRRQLEAYLDKGRGACHLSVPALAELVQQAFLHKHSTCYELKAWCVMPNHVHVLFKTGDTPMSAIIKEWKRYTGREGNRLLGCKGAFWVEDYWDTFMRDAEHEQKAIRYIENNPVKACFIREPSEWLWSSAKFRDEQGMLVI